MALSVVVRPPAALFAALEAYSGSVFSQPVPWLFAFSFQLSSDLSCLASTAPLFWLGRVCLKQGQQVFRIFQDLQKGKLFSLEEQVEHKVQLVQKIAAEDNTPLVLVGHSIGAHMALCVFKKFPDKVRHVVALYPFLATNERSSFQSFLKWSLRQAFLCEALAYFAGFMGKLPKMISRGFLKNVFGRSWSQFSVDVACEYLLQVQLPFERPEDHSIDLIPSSAMPKTPPYRVNAVQQEEIMTQSDACGSSIGAVLIQDEHAIAYESRILRKLEQHMLICKELLALIDALQLWKHCLLGVDFNVQTHH
ncbi:hypothetical protein L7F22_053225 [Adiantum nelumboides]|nr:hypothetical protein [Adiantum nelumboides]